MGALERFIESLPPKPYATDDFNEGLHIVPKARALGMAYVQLNGVVRRFIPLDIDRPGAAFDWDDAGLPAPTIITISERGHCHYLYALEGPVLFPDTYNRIQARQKPINFYKAVKEAFRRKLDADPGYVGIITKNPFHGRWKTITHDRVYTLGHLAEYVDLRNVRPYEAGNLAVDLDRVPVIPEGYRNDKVFDLARKLTYPRVKECSSYEDLFNVVMNLCAMLNMRCEPPLRSRELFTMTKSITGYSWRNRDAIIRGYKNRGVCGFTAMLPVMEAEARKLEVKNRQAAGALYTADLKRQATEDKIKATLADLQAQGKKPTKAAVARLTNLNRDTVYQYAHLWK